MLFLFMFFAALYTRKKGKLIRNMFMAYALPNTWTNKFVYLNDPGIERVPLGKHRKVLKEAGFREKAITFEKDGEPADVRKKLFEIFPELQHANGFKLMHVEGQKLELLDCPAGGFSVKGLIGCLKKFSENKRKTPHRTLYIRPVQVSRLLSILRNNIKGECILGSSSKPFADSDSYGKGPCIIHCYTICLDFCSHKALFCVLLEGLLFFYKLLLSN